MIFRRNETAPAPAPPAGGPAISLEKVRQHAPDLADRYKKAQISLQKKGILGQRAAVSLLIDRSGSMYDYFVDGTVEALGEQALGLTTNVDDDGIVPTYYFDTQVYGPYDLVLGQHQGRLMEIHKQLGGRSTMGGTDYVPAMRAALDDYLAGPAYKAGIPGFGIFQTDGKTWDEEAVKRFLIQASSKPFFWQFVGYGREKLRLLESLDTLRGRKVDNAGFFPVGPRPKSMSDETFYDGLMNEFPQYLPAARSAGIVR